MTSRTDANNLTTTWSVDGYGRVMVEKRPDGNETRTYLKRCAGDCPFHATTAQITDMYHGSERIAVPQVIYRDSANHIERNVTWGFDGTPIVVDQRYDEFGRLFDSDQPRFENSSAFLASRRGYDYMNRVTSVTTKDASGTDQTTTTEYHGLRIDHTNPLLQQRTEYRDVLGQLRSVIDSNAPRGTTNFTYDPFGGLHTTTDPNGNVITVDYDNLGRKIGLHDPDLGWVQYVLDPVGQVYAQISPVQRDKGQTTWMSYDLLGRMTARYEGDLPGGLESHWIFDTAPTGKGQLAEAYTGKPANKDYRRLQRYDSLGRASVVTQYLRDGQYTAVPDYDTWGRVISHTYRRGNDGPKVFNLRYNNYGYLARVDRGTQMLWTVSKQDAANRVISAELGNGLTQKRSPNAYIGQLDHGEVLTSANTVRLQEIYQYDAIGNVKTRGQYWDLGGFQETFEYDTLNRLSSSQVGQTKLGYTYDAAGNILTKDGVGTYTYPAQGANASQPHAVQSVSSIQGIYVYDKNGNLLSGGGRTLSWTSFDMPLTISKGTTASATFYYGPEHQRVRQARNDGDVIYAGTQEVEPAPGGGIRVKTYWPNGLGVEIEQGGTTQLNWTHVDRLGSPIAMTAEDGTIRADGKLEYDAWGKRRSAIDNISTDDHIDGKIDNRGFTGHEMLDQLDLVHMNGRVYDPLIGKFMSGDPLVSDPMNGQRYNRYSYVLNNPTNLTDPTGFCETQTGSHICGGGTPAFLACDGNCTYIGNGGIVGADVTGEAPTGETGNGAAAGRPEAEQTGPAMQNAPGQMTPGQREFLKNSSACLPVCGLPAGAAASGGAAGAAVGGAGLSGNSSSGSSVDPLTGETHKMTNNERLEKAISKAFADAATGPKEDDPTVRVRHYTTPEFLTGIRLSTVINPSRGTPVGVFVEVCPCGPLKTAGEDWGTADKSRTNSYVEFDARRDSLVPLPKIGPRDNGAVIPSPMPYPISDKNPVYYQSPWWKFWEHPVSH